MRFQWRIIPYLYSSLLLLSLLLSDCAALEVDTLYADQPVKDGDTIVSKGKMFELEFFSPWKSKNRYLGIWYKKISICTVVWVANRETHGLVWSSNATVSGRSNNPAVVQLLDTGNLAVCERYITKNSTNQNLIWQSFDYPGDTVLPGMKFGKDLVTGLQRYTTSWKNPDDHSIGAYSNTLDTSGYPQAFGRQGQVLVARLGHWNGLDFCNDQQNRVSSQL